MATKNFNDTTPAAPVGGRNVEWQQDAGSPDNISAYVPNLVTDLAGKQAALGFTPEDVANKSTDGTMAADSDTLYPSQKATKTYADTKLVAPPGLTGEYLFYNGTAWIATYNRGPLNTYWGVSDSSASVSLLSQRNTTRWAFSTATAVAATATERCLLKISSTASTGNTVGLGASSGGSNPCLSFGILKWFRARTGIGQTTNTRMWIGVVDALNLWVNLAERSDTWFGNSGDHSFVGFRFSPTTAGDTHWMCVVQNTHLNQTVTSSGVIPDTGMHVFEFYYDGSHWQFYIDGVNVASVSTNKPATSTLCDAVIALDNGGTTTAGFFQFDHMAVTDGGGV